MGTTNKSPNVHLVTGFVSAVSFIADLIAVALFVSQLLEGRFVSNFEGVVVYLAVIVAIFIFAFLLFYYTSQEYSNISGIVGIFSWIYILFSSAILIIISLIFMGSNDYGLGEFIGYIFLVVLIAGLGTITASVAKIRLNYFSIPFMVVALAQIYMWLFLILERSIMSLNWYLMGNLFLFLFTGIFIVFYIGLDKLILKSEDYVLNR